MKKNLVFREDYDEYDRQTIIEVGYEEFPRCLFRILPENEVVETDCEDDYYNYEIDFDDFLAIADRIRDLRRKNDI